MVAFLVGAHKKICKIIFALLLLHTVHSAHAHETLKDISLAIIAALDPAHLEKNNQMDALHSERKCTMALGLYAHKILRDKLFPTDALGTPREVAQLQEKLKKELHEFIKKEYISATLVEDPVTTMHTKIAPIVGQDETVAGNLANWGTTTVETNVTINNNNGGTVSGPALKIASFAQNAALLVTTTAGSIIAEMFTDLSRPALSLASNTGVLGTPPTGTRLMVNGPVVHGSATGTVMTITGNATNAATLSIGNGSTTAPALQLMNNPTSANADFALTIDAAGNVKQTSVAFQSLFLVNGGQPGPLTIGTTNASTFSLVTNNTNRISIDQNGTTTVSGNVDIGTSLPITQLEVVQNNPILTGTAATGTAPYGLYVQGRYVYVPSRTSNLLQIFDISNNPANPTLIGSIGTGLNQPYSVYVQGNYAYVVNFGGNTLQVFDVSNPTAPALVGTSATTGLNQPIWVYVQGRYAFVSNSGGNTIQIFDVANPAAPIAVGSVGTTAIQPRVIVAQGRYLYAAEFAYGFEVFDMANPAQPVSVGFASAGFESTGLYVQGRYAYVTCFGANSLQIFDISNPTSPTLVGTATGLVEPVGVFVQGRYAYVLNSIGGGTLQIFDVSTPSAPVSVGNISTGSTDPLNIFVQGRYAYLVNQGTGSGANTLEVVDLGGAYIQQLEAGGMEVGTLQTRENMTVNNDIDIKGGTTIGKSLNVGGNIGVYAGGILNSVVTSNGTASAPAYSFINTNTSTGMYSPATNQLALSTYGQARLNIDATGSVTQKSNYKVYAYKSTAQGVSAATATVLFNTELIDTNNNFTPTTGIYVVPVTGYYFVSANICFTIASATTSASTTATRTVNLAVNGTAQTGYTNAVTPGYAVGGLLSTAGSTGPFLLETTGVLFLTVGQSLTVQFTTTQTDTITTNDTHLSIHYLSF